MKRVKSRNHYHALFQNYPDVVDTVTACKMLGGVGLSTLLKLIQQNEIKHIHYFERYYLIPKEWLIDYILSDHYAEYKRCLHVQV